MTEPATGGTVVVALTSSSRRWVVASTAVLALVGSVLLLFPDGSGRFPALVVFLPAALLTSLCLRMQLRMEGTVVIVCNEFRTWRVAADEVEGISDSIGPNIGMMSLAWYWAFRKRNWFLVLGDGSRVRVGVFTEVRRDGAWCSVGTASAPAWISELALPGST